MKTSIRKIGNSAGAILPAILLKKLHLSQGDPIEINEFENKIIITPCDVKPSYSLKELLEQCDEDEPMNSELHEWNNIEAVGKEVL